MSFNWLEIIISFDVDQVTHAMCNYFFTMNDVSALKTFKSACPVGPDGQGGSYIT